MKRRPMALPGLWCIGHIKSYEHKFEHCRSLFRGHPGYRHVCRYGRAYEGTGNRDGRIQRHVVAYQYFSVDRRGVISVEAHAMSPHHATHVSE